MRKFPEKLIDALKALGLYESEAKVYSALVLLDRAEPRELVDALDISKPSVYESLRSLEDRGLILQMSAKPAVYQPVEPRVALRMLMDVYDQAREEASEYLEELRKARVKEKSASSNLWSIYGSNTIDYKVRDMLENAKSKVNIGLAERYLGYLDWLDGRKDIDISIIFFSDGPGAQEKLEERFRGHNAAVKILSIDYITKTKNSYIAESGTAAGKIFDYNNMLILIVDDRESLNVPPLPVEEISALYTNNPVLISTSSVFFASPPQGTAAARHGDT